MARIVAFVPDMMDRSRVAAAAAATGHEFAVVRSAGDLVATPAADLVLLDLGRPGVLDVLPELAGVPSVGFASHVDRNLIRDARRAGCGRVLARSKFFADLGQLFADLAPA